MFLTNYSRTPRSYRVEQCKSRVRRFNTGNLPTIAIDRLNPVSMREQKGTKKS